MCRARSRLLTTPSERGAVRSIRPARTRDDRAGRRIAAGRPSHGAIRRKRSAQRFVRISFAGRRQDRCPQHDACEVTCGMRFRVLSTGICLAFRRPGILPLVFARFHALSCRLPYGLCLRNFPAGLKSCREETPEDGRESVYRHYYEFPQPPSRPPHPVRLAVSGVPGGPSLFDMMAAPGKDTCVRRIRKAVGGVGVGGDAR